MSVQTNALTGDVTLELGGQRRVVAFTMGSLLRFVGLSKAGLQEAIDTLGSGNPDAIVPLVYAGLEVRAKQNALPPDFDLSMCREWMAEIIFLRADELSPLMSALTESFQALGNRMGLTTTPEPAAALAPAPKKIAKP